MNSSLMVPISEFCQTGSGITPSRQRGDYYGGAIPWVKSGELRESKIFQTEECVTDNALAETSLKLIPAGALLVAMYGATVGRVGLLGIQATTNQAVCHIVPDPKRADARYLFHALQQKARELVRQGVGGAQPNISQGIIKDTRIYLPPLDEQKRIAAILDQADGLRQNRRRTLEILERLPHAYFVEMFGDPVFNSMEWPLTPLGDLGNLERGISKHRPRNDPVLLNGSYPLIQTGDIANCDGYVRRYNATYSKVGLRQSRIWPKGTLCITIAANIGKTGILAFDACFPDSVVGFTPRSSVRTEYVQFWMSFIQRTLEDDAPQFAQKNINLAILRELSVPLPPLSLQDEFVLKVDGAYRLKSAYRTHLAKLDALFVSLQHRAFNGELTLKDVERELAVAG